LNSHLGALFDKRKCRENLAAVHAEIRYQRVGADRNPYQYPRSKCRADAIRYPLLKTMAGPVTSLIARLQTGDRTALDQLMPLVYRELHKIAEGYLGDERPSHTLQPTALVNEAYMRLVGVRHPNYQSRAHFYGVAAGIMRQILVDHTRSRHAAKRGGYAVTLAIDDKLDAASPREPTVIALDDALISLAAVDASKARLVELRFFGGMTAEEIAEFLSDSVHRVRHEMRLALAWLHREIAR
jgi:RNA polymerase sigma-70 factor, ECF subfamily